MAPRWMVYLAHRWRIPKVMVALFVLELPLTVACLALFGIADPDTYRTTMWQIGSDNGFNSNPNEILYAAANYRPIHVPLIWSSHMTQFNIVISVLSMFILLVKSAMFIMHGFLPILSVVVHALLVALYAVSVSNQSTPDLSNTDPKQVPNLQRHMPWYLSKGCSYATGSNYGFCMQARASFGVTIVMMLLFITYLIISVHSAIITKAEKAERQADMEEDIELKKYSMYDMDGLTREEKWEQNRQMFANLPKTPVTPSAFARQNPMTPRTTAFQQLSGGEASAIGRGQISNAGPSRPLALRQYSDGNKVPDAR